MAQVGDDALLKRLSAPIRKAFALLMRMTGNPEIRSGEETISVLLGNGDGTFRQGNYYASSSGAGALAVADVNGDGKPDVVSVGGSVGVMLGNGDGTFQPQVVYTRGKRRELRGDCQC